jgi:hypothetical protein
MCLAVRQLGELAVCRHQLIAFIFPCDLPALRSHHAMLSVSPHYLALLDASDNAILADYMRQCAHPVGVSPSCTLFGSSTWQPLSLSHDAATLATSSREAVLRISQRMRGRVLTDEEKEKETDIPWLTEFSAYAASHPADLCRFARITDTLIPANVACLHFMIWRFDRAPPLPPTYWIRDLNSPLGVYLNDVKLEQGWVPLRDHSMIRFSPLTMDAAHRLVQWYDWKEAGSPAGGLVKHSLQKGDLALSLVFSYDVPPPRLAAAAVAPSSGAAAAATPPSLAKRPRHESGAAAAAAAAASSAPKRGAPEAIAAASAIAIQRSSVTKALLEEFNCGICLNLIYECAVLACGHSFCHSCIKDWLSRSKTCPYCMSVQESDLRHVLAADGAIEVLVAKLLSAADREERADRVRMLKLGGR